MRKMTFGKGKQLSRRKFIVGSAAVAERPSMVTILSEALTLLSGTEQERITSPLM